MPAEVDTTGRASASHTGPQNKSKQGPRTRSKLSNGKQGLAGAKPRERANLSDPRSKRARAGISKGQRNDQESAAGMVATRQAMITTLPKSRNRHQARDQKRAKQ